MRHIRQLIIFTLVATSAACSSDNSDKPQGVISTAQQQALDKANEVDALSKKQQEDMRKQLESID